MTDHYVGIDVHKRQAQVAVIDAEGTLVEEVRVVARGLNTASVSKETGTYGGFSSSVRILRFTTRKIRI